MNIFNRMPQVSIVFGILLIATGVIAFVGTGSSHVTALIPAFVGAPILLCGVIAAIKPSTLKHVMHVAAMLGTLGFLAAAGRLIPGLIKGSPGAALASTGAMTIICGLYVFCCVKSFIAAKKARLAAEAAGGK